MTDAGATTKTSHYVTLDAVRGVAAIAVMIHHICNAQGIMGARYGYLAVDLFFMLSGFVIGRAYEDKMLAGLGWWPFMKIRLVRLYPVLLLGIGLGLFASWLGASSDGPPRWSMLAQAFLIPDLSGGVIFPINVVLWSLFFEVVINAVHAAVVRQLTTPVLIAVLVVIAPVAAWAGWYFGSFNIGYAQHNFIGGFIRVIWGYGLGLLIHRLMASGRLRAPQLGWALLVVLALTALVLLTPKIGPSPIRIYGAVFVLFPAIVLVSLGDAPVRRLHGLAKWLGGISYPLYAIHHPLVELAAWAFGAQMGWLRWALVGAAILILSTLVEFLYDAPLRKRLRAFVRAQPRLATV